MWNTHLMLESSKFCESKSERNKSNGRSNCNWNKSKRLDAVCMCVDFFRSFCICTQHDIDMGWCVFACKCLKCTLQTWIKSKWQYFAFEDETETEKSSLPLFGYDNLDKFPSVINGEMGEESAWIPWKSEEKC